MYNVGFGDCFCLRDRKGSLLVDFGTSNKKIGKLLRDEVFDQVISDLSTIPKKSLLLSHFHPDHLSGLLYMINEREQVGEFATIYLPDVFSTPEMTKILTLQILADLMADSRLPGRQVSLTALLETLCVHPCRLAFLKRGMVFEQKYQALWPDTDYIGREVDEILASIPETLMEGWTVLYNLAEQMRQVIWSMSEKGAVSESSMSDACVAGASLVSDAAVGNVPSASDTALNSTHPLASEGSTRQEMGELLLKHFGQIRKSQEVVQLLHYFETRQLMLRQFKHKISIVFQNQSDGELNVLFTGDIPSDYLQLIADNYDGKLPLHEHYWCIKVPHHGTDSHYFDFSGYTPDNMMISNGIYYANSRKQEREARISGRYAGLFYIEDTTMYCSSSENCEGGRNGCGCSCREHEIIDPGYYRDI
jgi:hypothetical protein